MAKISKASLRKIIKEEIAAVERHNSLGRVHRQNISENFITDALGSMGSGIAQRIKHSVCEYVLEHMGVPENHFMGKVICNTFENLDMSEIGVIMFGADSNDPSRCEVIAENLLEGIAESLLEKLREEALPDSNGTLFKFIEDSIINSIVDNNQLAQSTAQVICKAASDVMDSVRN